MGPGGAEGTRTPYLNTASVALSRMSYSPRVTRRGCDPLIGPVTEATRRRLRGGNSPGSPSRLTGEFDPGCRLAPPGGSLARGVYCSRSQPIENSRDLRRMSNAKHRDSSPAGSEWHIFGDALRMGRLLSA